MSLPTPAGNYRGALGQVTLLGLIFSFLISKRQLGEGPLACVSSGVAEGGGHHCCRVHPCWRCAVVLRDSSRLRAELLAWQEAFLGFRDVGNPCLSGLLQHPVMPG